MRTLTAGGGRSACDARAEDLAERGAEVGRAQVLADVLGADLRGPNARASRQRSPPKNPPPRARRGAPSRWRADARQRPVGRVG